ncbi:MAG: hypothetical protein ACI80V_000393 [Rhodothermales bacterium]
MRHVPNYAGHIKTELIGLASMAEIPLVIVNVQRGRPSTGLPTKVEQGDLLQAMFGTHGDAPQVVMAPATIDDCFYAIPTARKIAETFRMPVIVLSDANLATGQQPFARPEFQKEWVAPPIDQRPVPEGATPYDWDDRTGLSTRFIPGQKGGMHTVTGLAHTRSAKVAYLSSVNQEGCEKRSLKLAALQKTLSPQPGYPFRYFFLDADYAGFYEREQRLGSLYLYFTALAIFIACLGLFGLASYVTSQRTREIGVRKALGASVGSVVALLTREFTVLVLVACAVAFPIGWLIMSRWLESFAYSQPIGWSVFVLSGSAAVAVAWITVSYQSIRAAIATLSRHSTTTSQEWPTNTSIRQQNRSRPAN